MSVTVKIVTQLLLSFAFSLYWMKFMHSWQHLSIITYAAGVVENKRAIHLNEFDSVLSFVGWHVLSLPWQSTWSRSSSTPVLLVYQIRCRLKFMQSVTTAAAILQIAVPYYTFRIVSNQISKLNYNPIY